LITGEHGTGKEVVAQDASCIVFRELRARLVAVNTGALPEGLFESELFGHVKGAFTDARADRIGRFELADGGNIFLTKLATCRSVNRPSCCACSKPGKSNGSAPRALAVVDVRVVAATNADLQAACANGTFREDLLFRLNTVEIHLPACANVREDIPALAGHFLARYAGRYRRAIQGSTLPRCSRCCNMRGRQRARA
jgi:transcriptional regulator with GAF, ATPase, and Fis domain